MHQTKKHKISKPLKIES